MKKALLVAVALFGLALTTGCCGCGPSLPELPSLGCGCDTGCNTGCNPCDPCGR